MTLLEFVLTVIFAGLGAYGGSYLRERGKNLATHEDLERLTKQVASTTRVAEEIKQSISYQDWARREWEALRRSKLEEIVSASQRAQGWLEESRELCWNREMRDPEGDPLGELGMLVRLYFQNELSPLLLPYIKELHANRVACLQMRAKVIEMHASRDIDALESAMDPVIAAYAKMMDASIPFEQACNATMLQFFAVPVSQSQVIKPVA